MMAALLLSAASPLASAPAVHPPLAICAFPQLHPAPFTSRPRFAAPRMHTPEDSPVHQRESEDEARRRVLAAMERGYSAADAAGRPPAHHQIFARQHEREEARKRMLVAMGGTAEQIRRGAGVAFGFGGEDDEQYGAEADEMDLLTGKPLRGFELKGDGFDGRLKDWKRVKARSDPNPPPMANTLRAPGQVPPPPHEDVAASAPMTLDDEWARNPRRNDEDETPIPDECGSAIEQEIALLDALEGRAE
ncbi:hypothetical protein AB1Y20_009370 [Prymnesium parvum]|uniref:Uncharacterized protein n=1 Tax=Prymnesium parvum TaxID=97485 RepID=A0AB34K058_PRYPA